jgi:UDPglucose 6-dehydrogenase
MATVQGKHPQLLQAVTDINTYQRRLVIHKVRELLGDDLSGKTIGLLGLAFKPNTDDMRDAPSITIAKQLLDAGATVKGYDPVSMRVTEQVMSGIGLCQDAYEVAESCDALVVITDWNEFKNLDMERIKKSMNQPVLIDGRNIYDPNAMGVLGFTYRGFGRGYDSAHEAIAAFNGDLYAKRGQA